MGLGDTLEHKLMDLRFIHTFSPLLYFRNAECSKLCFHIRVVQPYNYYCKWTTLLRWHVPLFPICFREVARWLEWFNHVNRLFISVPWSTVFCWEIFAAVSHAYASPVLSFLLVRAKQTTRETIQRKHMVEPKGRIISSSLFTVSTVYCDCGKGRLYYILCHHVRNECVEALWH